MISSKQMMKPAAALLLGFSLTAPAIAGTVELGVRPGFLIDLMQDSELKTKLRSCAGMDFQASDFSIGHRGAPLQFPEHTAQSNIAAARQGAGILECDVTFTADRQLVCRHGQNDLHTTTNILATPLAEKCTTPFTPATGADPAIVECRTSDLTLADFTTLTGKMDAANKMGTTIAEYMDGTANFRTDLYASQGGTLLTHAESISLFASLGAKFTPELKSPVVDMPYNGWSQADYAQALIDEYKAAGIPASDVWAQSFNLDDVLYWIKNEPEFGAQAVYLDGRYSVEGFDPMLPESWDKSMVELKEMGVNYIAPPTWMLLTLRDGEIVPSVYAEKASEAGLKIITWTLERSGPLNEGGGWYYQSISEAIDGDGRMFEVLDVLAQDVGVVGVFSDWPATVTYYANCMGL